MSDIIEVPYWVDAAAEVKTLRTGNIPPSMFQNSSEYRLRLVGLSFIGEEASERAVEVGTLPTVHPEWSSNLLVDIGKSGCSDQNLVRSSLTNLCGTTKTQRQKWGANNMGRSYWLPKAYEIAPDEGLRVEVQARWPGYDGEDESGNFELKGAVPTLTFIAKGYDSDGYPVQLAAASSDTMDLGGPSVTLNSADLFNNGLKPIFITSFCFKEMDTVIITNVPAYGWKGSGAQIAWRVNPSNPDFTQFMPNATTIPTGLLAPLDRCYDGGSEGPLCYWFPEDTYLDPKQALSVRLASESTSEVDIRVCMFGQLEVV